MADSAKSGRHNHSGLFKKGQSGNPAGCPKGRRHSVTIMAEQWLDGQAEALSKKATDMALAGDSAALKLCMDRLVPLRKGCPVTFALPDIKAAADITNAFGMVARAMANGQLTPDEAGVVGTVLEGHRRALETSEFDARLRALEEVAK
jgi:Family of unknown function (DUF5681)